MPCLTDEIDCLLCGARTTCSQVEGESGSEKWSKYFCDLLSVEDAAFQENIHQAFYCVPCTCRITSITKISGLVENMKIKLGEIKDQIEDGLILSNPHLCGDADGENGEKNQNKAREGIMTALEEMKKKKAEPKSADASVETDPVIIVEEELKTGQSPMSPEAYYIVLNDNSCDDVLNKGTSDKECQCTLLNENVISLNDNDSSQAESSILEASSDVGESSDGRKRQLIKIRISSDTVSQEIIDTLTKQQGNSQTRQLIIRGYREIETPQQQSPRQPPESGNAVATKKRVRKPKALTVNDQTPEITETSKSPKTYDCKICGALFKSHKEKKIHVDGTHKEDNKFKCSECDYTSVADRSLIHHNETVHNFTKPIANPEVQSEQLAEEQTNGDMEYDEDEELLEESDPDYGCPSEEDDDEEIVVGARRGRPKRKSSPLPKSTRKRAKTRMSDVPPVIKVASNKRISGLPPTTPAEAPVPDDGASPRKSGRLRSNYRTYFY